MPAEQGRRHWARGEDRTEPLSDGAHRLDQHRTAGYPPAAYRYGVQEVHGGSGKWEAVDIRNRCGAQDLACEYSKIIFATPDIAESPRSEVDDVRGIEARRLEGVSPRIADDACGTDPIVATLVHVPVDP